MNTLDYPSTIMIVAAMFVAMTIVAVLRGKGMRQALQQNAIIAALFAFAASLVFAAARIVR